MLCAIFLFWNRVMSGHHNLVPRDTVDIAGIGDVYKA